MDNTSLALIFLSICLVFAGVATTALSIVTWALYRRVENVQIVSARLDVLESSYQKLRAQKAGNVAAIKARAAGGVPPQIQDALNDLTDEERSLFA